MAGRYKPCNCCYCTYLAGEMPSRHDGRRNEEIRERLRKVLKQREEVDCPLGFIC